MKAKQEIDRDTQVLELNEIWRLTNLEAYKFTWWTNNPSKKARLDYLLVSESILTLTTDCKIMHRYRSDHAPVRITLNESKTDIGPRYWRLNTDLLKDKELSEKIKEEILLI